MKKIKNIIFVCFALCLVYLAYDNYKLRQQLSEQMGYLDNLNSMTSYTEMKLESFLQELSASFDSEVEAVARPIAKEEVINGFKVLAEQFNKEK
jgi:hypothetical protein|tara:strand:- start:1268 stop:1549 length:282 start_codon:yes stop_codon:yes gene_type:complete